MITSPKFTILIVDDNYNNLFSLKALIEEYIDAAVIQAISGEEALKQLFKHSIDLIILDVQMEGMNGFEVASIIKSRRKTQDIPIVFLTASYIGEEFKKRGYKIGAVDYLTKPIDEYQLVNRINTYLKLIEKERSMNLILEQKVYEQVKELVKAKEAAEAANEAKDMFLANISHELRTPLNIIMSTIQIMNTYLNKEQAVDKEKFRRNLATQRQNCYRLLRLINNLIDITKLSKNYFPINITKCNIIQIIEDITQSVVTYVESKGINLTFDTDVEEKFIECDLDAVERIMLNLLSNAVKFTPQGGSIYVNIETSEELVKVSVCDTGIGIDEDKLNIIFERFKQADNLLTRSHEGSGIGLSLVKSLVEMHGGRIYVKSKHNQGSQFTVELPVNASQSTENINLSPVYKANEDVMQRIYIEFSDIYFQEQHAR